MYNIVKKREYVIEMILCTIAMFSIVVYNGMLHYMESFGIVVDNKTTIVMMILCKEYCFKKVSIG